MLAARKENLYQSHVTRNVSILFRTAYRRQRFLLVICGPCSIHDCDAAIEYAQRPKSLSDKVKQKNPYGHEKLL
ncbi:hypothetical protein [Psychrobacter sp.]|uniref:hypothetical protein n=1 Tax=Psychrobacter sp. TaxID=56811 RepID=UPI00338F6575